MAIDGDLDLFRRVLSSKETMLARSVGNFALYETFVAGHATNILWHRRVDPSASQLSPDDETLEFVENLRSKGALSGPEREFLEHFEFLEQVREAIVRFAKSQAK